MKKWTLPEKISSKFKDQFPEINPIILQILANRGLKTQEEIDEFLMPDYSQDLHDPFLFSEMDKAVNRIFQAIEKKEKIFIYGDYDADGICSSVLLFKTFKKLGASQVEIYIPDREKGGHGLNSKGLKMIKDEKTNLIITCDCGITNKNEVKLAKDLRLEVIVTDHHLIIPELVPQDALAIIDPHFEKEKYPFKFLAGVGVAFKLVQALIKKSSLEKKEAFEKWLLDLVAVGTIADMMPLLGENRTLTKYGLIVLNKTQNFGLRALIEAADLTLGDLTSHQVAFQISPRINASGRMNQTELALKLLISSSKIEAKKIAEQLNRLNSQRQNLVDQIFKGLCQKLGPTPKEKFIFDYNPEWPIGILGLAAMKLNERYNRPAVLASRVDEKITGTGRAERSNFNLVKKLEKLKKYFSDFGGHAGAAGFSLKPGVDFEQFRKNLIDSIEKELERVEFSSEFFIDCQVQLEDLNWDLLGQIESCRPFGEANQEPKFLVKNLTIESLECVGQNCQHLKISAEGRKLIWFNFDSKINLKTGDEVEVVVELGENIWNGNKELQLKVVDLRKII